MNPNIPAEVVEERKKYEAMWPDTKDKVICGRVSLYTDHPFLAVLAQWLVPLKNWQVPTAGVTGDAKFYLNPAFGALCNNRDMLFVVAHETMHLVTATNARMPSGAMHMMWNIASDIAINYLIINKEHGMGINPPRDEVCKPLYGGEFEEYWGWTTEDIYYDLLKQASNCPACKANMKGQPEPGEGDEEGEGQGEEGEEGQCQGHGLPSQGKHKKNCPFKDYWWDGSGSTCEEEGMTEEQRAEWKQRVASAAAEARQAGKLPGALGNFVHDVLQPKRNWRRELRMATSHALRKRYDWKKCNRRTAGRVRTPGRSPYMPEAVIYMDTSGSMSDEDLHDAINEMAGILKLTGGEGTLILGDCDVYYCDRIDLNALKRLPVQRGGTDFRPVFEKIEEEKIKPAIFIGFTDLEGPFPSQSPSFPVVWCRPKGYKSDAPFGKIIDVEI